MLSRFHGVALAASLLIALPAAPSLAEESGLPLREEQIALQETSDLPAFESQAGVPGPTAGDASSADMSPNAPPPAGGDLTNQLQNQRIQSLERQLDHFMNRMSDSDGDDQPATPGAAYPNVRLTGFFQLDAGWFGQDTDSRDTFGDIEDDRGFRRARLAAIGDVAENINFMIEMDFAFPGRPSFMDVLAEVTDVPWLGSVRIGQWRQPFGLDELNSVRALTFFERPTMFAFAPFRQTGVGFFNTNEDQTATWAASVYGFPTDFFGNSFGDRGYGTAERVTGLLIDECDGRRILHAGFGHALAMPRDAFFYRNVPEYGGPFGGPAGNAPDVPFFINSGFLEFDHSNIVNLELAGVYDSFYWQSELRAAYVDFGDDVVQLPAFYIQAAYLLTGEVMPYNKDAGTMGRIKPRRPLRRGGGWGAWEIAGRYSWIDLNPAAPYSQGGAGLLPNQPPGGELNDLTLGVNWYLHTNLKVQFQYVRAMLNNSLTDSATDIVALRTQLDF